LLKASALFALLDAEIRCCARIFDTNLFALMFFYPRFLMQDSARKVSVLFELYSKLRTW